MIEEKLLTRKECQACDFGDDPQDIDYGKLYENRFKLLRKAYERANVGEDQEFEAYRRENAWWLDDYALFMAVKDRFDGVAWNEWAEGNYLEPDLRYGKKFLEVIRKYVEEG